MQANEKLRKNAAFVLKFLAIYIAAELIIVWLPIQGMLDWIAWVEGLLTGYTVSGNSILVSGTAFIITNSCTGLVSTSILGAIIFSLRKPEIVKKISIFLAGAIILFILNIIRIYFVVQAGAMYGAETAEQLHVASWFAMSAAIIILWYYFTKRITKTENFSELL